MRIGIDVGGTNTDAVLMAGTAVRAFAKLPTTADIETGVVAAIRAVIADSGTAPDAIAAVMIGTTQFTNALVERSRLDCVGVIRLASPSGEAMPPMIGWPSDLVARIGSHVHLLPGGYEVDGREIAPLDEAKVREAARSLRREGIEAIALSSVFAPLNAAMERRAADIVREEHPAARVTLSASLGRLGLIERENAAILNAALGALALGVVGSFERALAALGIAAPLYVSQNDGTLIGARQAADYPVLAIGSGPTNSMRGAAFLSGVTDAIVLDVGGTTTDIGVLSGGFPRESSLSVDIGGVRTNFRMPDVLAIGLGGGTRISVSPNDMQIGPASVGFAITREAYVFGGATLTASDVAVAAGRVRMGDPDRLPPLAPEVIAKVSDRMTAMIEDGVDRMKTSRGDAAVIAVGGGAFLVPDTLRGATRVIRPPHAEVANAVGAAIAQVGALEEEVVRYDHEPREAAIARLRARAVGRVAAAGGRPETVAVSEIDEVFLSYLPGRAAQLRLRAVGDLALMAGGVHAD